MVRNVSFMIGIIIAPIIINKILKYEGPDKVGYDFYKIVRNQL